ncbi:MAG: hypothetical protein KAR40_11595 [Candidatus Sabulitectum sp.]|nr:hypothetical protein [Candidatus Sabulitectum sp.]
MRYLITAFVFGLFLTACNNGTSPSQSTGTCGWAVGGTCDGYAMIMHTGDGGNWSRQGTPATVPEAALSSVSVVDSNTVWAAGGLSEGFGVVVKTTDGGENWLRMGSEISIPEETSAIDGVNATTAWVVGANNSILRTDDGGVIWYDMSDPQFPDCNWSSVYLVNQSNIWVCGDNTSAADGQIIHSTDGGVSWRSEADSLLDGGWYMITIKAWDENNAWAVGHGYLILNTTDGGDNWEIVTPDSMQYSQNDANGIALLSPDDAWVAIDYGNIWKTADGGENWTLQNPGYGGFFLLRISALDTSTAWVSGQSGFGTAEGIILHTSDGGNSWTRQDDGTNQGLWDVGIAGAMP